MSKGKILLIMMIVLGLAGNAQAAIEFDAVSTGVDGGGDSSLSWSHTIGSGSDRILIVSSAVEDSSESDAAITSIKYNNVNMTLASGSSIYENPVKTDLYYMLDEDLPSAGTYTVEITYNGNVSDLIGGAISLTGAEQQAPEAVATSSNDDSSTISTNVTTLTNNAWVVDVVAHSRSDVMNTTTSGMVERYDETSAAHTAAGSTKPVASAGSTTMSWELDDGIDDPICHSVAAITESGATPPAPVADFSGSPLSGDAPLEVDFTDASTGSITSWSWTFGDGGTSTAQDPSHEYTSEDDYTVSLTVTGTGGSDIETKTDYISVSTTPPAPVADFSGSPLSGDAPLTVDFTDASTGSITSWSWTFGDGGTSTAEDPSHEYTSEGDYTVSLTVTGPGGSDIETNVDYISVSTAVPVPDFVADKTSGSAPLTVNFTDLSTGDIDTWKYDVDGDGDDDWSDSSGGDAEWIYTEPNVYTVSLKVRDAVTGVYYTETKTDYITVTEPSPAVAAFTASPLSGDEPLTVQFTDQSTGTVTEWSWTFGDGGTSTAVSPSYEYLDAGTYDVILDVNGSMGSDSEVKYAYITVETPGAPVAEFVGSPLSGDYPLTVNFTDQSTGTIDTWSWDFGDGGTSTAENPSHEYTYAGDFRVELEVIGSAGRDTETKTDYITVTAPGIPVAAFTASPTSGNEPLTVDFTDASTGEIDSWTWDFGDGGTSTAENPTHEYANDGVYTVGLQVSGPSGSDEEVKTNYITVNPVTWEETWTTYNKANTNNGIPHNYIRSVIFDGDITWVATNGGGITKFDGTNWTVYKTGQGLVSNACWDLDMKANGDLVIGTNNGLSIYNGSSFTNYQTGNSDLSDNNIRAVKVDSSGNIWIGSIGGGVDKFDGTNWTNWDTDDDVPHNYVWGIDIDSAGTVWVATMSGVGEFDGTTWTEHGSQVLPNDDCYDICVDDDDNVWVATIRGLGMYDGTDWTEYEEENGMPKENSRSIAVDSAGVVFAGTYGGGVCELDGDTWTVYNVANSDLPNNYVWAVGIASTLEQWFGTNAGVGVHELEEVEGPGAPVANFTGSPTDGDAPLTVDFTDASTGEITSWTWDFGDAGSSTAQSPSHEYEAAGIYSVALTVAGPGGTDTLTRTDYITVDPTPPNPDFVANPVDGLAPLTVSFTDMSTGDIDTWKYDFDGDESDDWSDSSSGSTEWTYTTAGLYTVSLKVRDAETSVYYTETKTDYINVRTPEPPTAEFSAYPESGSLPLNVQFTDLSTGDDVNSWSWTFGDGGTSTARNPYYTYDSEGDYDVSLTASSAYGSDIETKTDFISVGAAQACAAEFSGSPIAGFRPLTVDFTDASTGSVSSWSWDFGDDSTSSQQHPTHQYLDAGNFTVSLTVSGPVNSDNETKTDYITVEVPPEGGSGLHIIDSPDDLTNVHPHLVIRGYGPDNGLWAKAQSTHAEIWSRLTTGAPTGATFSGTTRNMSHLRPPFAFIISKQAGYGQFCQDMVLDLNGFYFTTGGDQGIADMETFISYCLAYDAIVDDPETTWLTSQQKASALATMDDFVGRLNMSPGATWRVRPTHNFMVLRAGDHCVGLYNLRGEAAYETAFNTAREYALTYHNERVNGLCNNAVAGTTAPLSYNGPRPTDGFPYEGCSYGAYQASRALVHRHTLEYNEYPNPETILDENKSGFAQNYNLAWLASIPPGAAEWADYCHVGDHGLIQGIRNYSAINKAVGSSDISIIPPATMARVGEWFAQTLIPTPKGGADFGWWQGYEFIWYDASIEPLHPDDAGVPLYVHLDDSEYHMYRESWDFADTPTSDVFIYFRNSAHDGHNYWAEGHSGDGVPYECVAQTSSHDGGDNGHIGMYKSNRWICQQSDADGVSDTSNCIDIDGEVQLMKDDGGRGYEIPALADTDCYGAVDSDYGHLIEADIASAYASGVVGDYKRTLIVLRDPMYALTLDELESGHTMRYHMYFEQGLDSHPSAGLYLTDLCNYEVMYPASGYTESGNRPIWVNTSSPQLLFLINPPKSSVSKSVTGGDLVATIGSDDIVYNPDGSSYTHGSISGNAKFFAERSGGALILKATSATGSQYGVSCNNAVNMSVSGAKASIYVYGSGTYDVTVTSPAGTDVFSITAGETVSRVLTGLNVDAPIADFFSAPTEGWDGYYTAEFVSLSTGWITDYLWEFGDGGSSTAVAASHKYSGPGLYTVKLTVSGPGGSDSMTKTDYIYVKDFSNYGYPDYVLTAATQAAFDAALDAIEASQEDGLAEGDPIWCGSAWCDRMKHGGGGRILFDSSIANSTIGIDWAAQTDEKRDWFGDNLIIDGQDRNIRFLYVGPQSCGQAENMSCLRIHGNDNIVRNITWDRFPDGLHMRGGMRNLIENVTVNTICEDAMSFNGSGNACIDCIARDCTYLQSTDKTFMYGGGGTLASAIITGMDSTNGNQAIRMTGGGRLVVRNSEFRGYGQQGPRFGGEKNLVIFESNYCHDMKNGVRFTDKVNAICRHNIFEDNTDQYAGIYCFGDDYMIRAYQNTITGNPIGVLLEDDGMIDLGGGSLDVHRWSEPWLPANDYPGTAVAQSWGQNTITGSSSFEVDNNNDLSLTVMAENNFWDYTTVSQVEDNEIDGLVDVDPLGIDVE